MQIYHRIISKKADFSYLQMLFSSLLWVELLFFVDICGFSDKKYSNFDLSSSWILLPRKAPSDEGAVAIGDWGREIY